jgi:hypothetical protein
MRFKLHQFIQNSDFYDYRNQLSEEGKQSLSCQILSHYYYIAYRHFSGLNESLCRYRASNGSTVIGNPSDLQPTNHRLETELLSLITELLVQLPNLDSVINDDSKTSEQDKTILKEAYSAFKGKIDSLFVLLGHSCFAVKKQG